MAQQLIFPFLVQIYFFFFFLNSWHILSQIHSYIFIRPLEKILTFKVLQLQVGFYDAEILVSLDSADGELLSLHNESLVIYSVACFVCYFLLVLKVSLSETQPWETSCPLRVGKDCPGYGEKRIKPNWYLFLLVQYLAPFFCFLVEK